MSHLHVANGSTEKNRIQNTRVVVVPLIALMRTPSPTPHPNPVLPPPSPTPHPQTKYIFGASEWLHKRYVYLRSATLLHTTLHYFGDSADGRVYRHTNKAHCNTLSRRHPDEAAQLPDSCSVVERSHYSLTDAAPAAACERRLCSCSSRLRQRRDSGTAHQQQQQYIVAGQTESGTVAG